MIRFVVQPHLSTLTGVAIYKVHEYSFDFQWASDVALIQHKGTSGAAEILIGTLMLVFGIDTRLLLYVWGYHSHTAWRRKRLPPPPSQVGGIRVELTEDLEAGVPVPLAEVNHLFTQYDPRTGWIRIGGVAVEGGAQYIEFATDTIAEIRGDKLLALWLRPRFEGVP